MAENLQGFPFWVLTFDKAGKPADSSAIDKLVREVVSEKITDLFVFSHGWNNDLKAALSLYDRFFEEVRKVLDSDVTLKNQSARIGVAGVIWPSILWPDDAATASMTGVIQAGGGGGVALGGLPPVPVAHATPQQIKSELRKGYDDARQLSLLDELTTMLEKQAKTDAALREFQAKLAALLESERTHAGGDGKQPDAAEGAIGLLSENKWRALLDVLGAQAMRGEPSGVAPPALEIHSKSSGRARRTPYVSPHIGK